MHPSAKRCYHCHTMSFNSLAFSSFPLWYVVLHEVKVFLLLFLFSLHFFENFIFFCLLLFVSNVYCAQVCINILTYTRLYWGQRYIYTFFLFFFLVKGFSGNLGFAILTIPASQCTLDICWSPCKLHEAPGWTTMPGYFCIFTGSELKSLHCHSKHFTHWSTAPAPNLFFFSFLF